MIVSESCYWAVYVVYDITFIYNVTETAITNTVLGRPCLVLYSICTISWQNLPGAETFLDNCLSLHPLEQ